MSAFVAEAKFGNELVRPRLPTCRRRPRGFYRSMPRSAVHSRSTGATEIDDSVLNGRARQARSDQPERKAKNGRDGGHFVYFFDQPAAWIKARRSGLMTSACVVHMPCGKPS